MSYIDIAFGVILLWGAYNGFKKGLIIEIATLIALGFGVYGSVLFSDYTGELLKAKFELDGQKMTVIAFAVTFLLIVISVLLLAKALEKVVNIMAMKLFNKIGGACFGMVKTGIILSFLLLLVEYADGKTHFIKQEYKTESILYSQLTRFAPTIMPVISNLKSLVAE